MTAHVETSQMKSQQLHASYIVRLATLRLTTTYENHRKEVHCNSLLISNKYPFIVQSIARFMSQTLFESIMKLKHYVIFLFGKRLIDYTINQRSTLAHV